MTRGIIYYTDGQLDERILVVCQEQLKKSGLPITACSLKQTTFGDVNIIIDGERGYPTLVKQIVRCLEQSTSDYVFFCEHDVLYPASHFNFTPPTDNVFYYNDNAWRWLLGSDTVIRHDRMLSLSQMCVNREFALKHYVKRQKTIEELGWDKVTSKEPAWARVMGYEPGQKKTKRGGFSNDDYDTWTSKLPVIDIRHRGTFSPPKTRLSDFRHKPKWWEEVPVDWVEGWDLRSLFL